MIYLSNFKFPSSDMEFNFFNNQKRTCYDTFYPFQILTRHHFEEADFNEITIFYGGNGSGKTTALNVIAEKLQIERDTLFNRSNFFDDYIDMCDYYEENIVPRDSRIITSDDVFDYMLNLRTINEGIDLKREELFDDYLDTKYSGFKFRTMDDYEELKKVNLARRKTQSQFVRGSLMDNVREQSNGESAFKYFTEKIKESALYLLDEPENSLSPERQLELVQFIEDSARFYDCQFIIATHSPFILSMKHAKIYNLDNNIVTVNKWTELSNVRVYYDFFKEHENEF